MSESTTEVWRVEGMTCGGCASSVTRVLTGAPGLLDLDVSHEQDQVRLVLDSAADRADLKARIERAGFDVVGQG